MTETGKMLLDMAVENKRKSRQLTQELAGEDCLTDLFIAMREEFVADGIILAIAAYEGMNNDDVIDLIEGLAK